HAPVHTKIFILSLHDALPISTDCKGAKNLRCARGIVRAINMPPSGFGAERAHQSTASISFTAAQTSSPGENSGPRDRSLSWHRRSEEHTSELQSRGHLVCRLL